ncbi:MAG: hypothetical protein ACETWQ_21745 [Phycisphaerae bacterium]
MAMPFIFAEPFIIFRIHYGIFALGEGYSPESIAVAEATIQERKENYRFFQTTGYVKTNFDEQAHVLEL